MVVAPGNAAVPARRAVTQMPRMAIEMRISGSVTPSSPRARGVSRSGATEVDLVVHAIHGRDESYCDEADHDTDEHDDNGLEVAREALDLVVELAVQVVRGGLELLVERTGVLTDAEHLSDRGRKQIRAVQWSSKPFAS